MLCSLNHFPIEYSRRMHTCIGGSITHHRCAVSSGSPVAPSPHVSNCVWFASPVILSKRTGRVMWRMRFHAKLCQGNAPPVGRLRSQSTIAPLYKRRFWKEEQKMKRGFSQTFVCKTLPLPNEDLGRSLGDASAEIAIMSLALWGTSDNCRQYVEEAHRVLESGGLFYIIDTTKRWSPEPLTTVSAGECLRTLLTSSGFRIVSEDVGVPFCMFICNKTY